MSLVDITASLFLTDLLMHWQNDCSLPGRKVAQMTDHFVCLLCMRMVCEWGWRSEHTFQSQFSGPTVVWGLGLQLSCLHSQQLYPLGLLTLLSSKTEVWGETSWGPWNVYGVHDTALYLKPSWGTMQIVFEVTCLYYICLRQVHTVNSRLALNSRSLCLSLQSCKFQVFFTLPSKSSPYLLPFLRQGLTL